MTLQAEDVKKIARLSKLSLSEQETDNYGQELQAILELVQQLDKIDTDQVETLAHPLDIQQRLRLDEVTEHDQHELFQKHAPATEADLYLVPQVIETND